MSEADATRLTAGLTDEEYGRSFAAVARHEPERTARGRFLWRIGCGDPSDGPEQLPLCLFMVMSPGEASQPTEAAAFAALGRAVREVHRLVPMLPGEVV